MLLALNTCGSSASVALGTISKDSKITIAASAELAVRTYSSRLIPEIAALLESTRATMQDIEAIVVVSGPGSFTGIRVGLSTAKGLAEPAAIPLIAVSSLALLAGTSGLPHVLAAIDAGRNEYYVGEYRHGDSLGEVLLSGEETIRMAKQPGAGVLVCDEGGSSACAVLSICGPVYVQPPGAAEAMRFASKRFLSQNFDDIETLEANYVRRSDAEVVRASRDCPGRVHLSVSIRNMMHSDVERVIELSRGSSEAPQWTPTDYERILVPEADSLLLRCAIVAAAGDDLRGFAVASWLQGEAADLESLMVVQEYRRQRIGGMLLEACMAWAANAGSSTLRLEVRASNVAALELYRHFGFRSIGARRAYYSGPSEDAVLLEVSLQ